MSDERLTAHAHIDDSNIPVICTSCLELETFTNEICLKITLIN